MTTAQQAAREAGAVLTNWRGRFEVSFKGHADLVTQADLAAQETIFRLLQGRFPDHGIIGEEQDQPIVGSSDYTWIVDPLDGTTNYVHDLPLYGVSIGLARGSELVLGVVYNPATGECFSAEQGAGAFLNGKRIQVAATTQLSTALVAASLPPQVDESAAAFREMVAALKSAQAIRRMGSAALNLGYVAAGRLDAYWATSVCSWDVAAGCVLVREAGGTVSHISGSPVDWRDPRIAASATAPLHTELLRMLEVS